MSVLGNIDRDGFAVVPGVPGERSCLELLREVEELLRESPAGVRGVAAKVHRVAAIAQSAAVRSLVDPVLGPDAQLVRSVLFNKSDEANWQAAWHQDLAIAVSEKAEVEGYSSWSVKDGVPHVQPPEEILEQMLTVRLHLDPADEANGALWVSPGSHRLGRLRAADAAAVAERNGKHWAERPGKTELRAFQASQRGGEMTCRLRADRVELEGACVFYLEGEVKFQGADRAGPLRDALK